MLPHAEIGRDDHRENACLRNPSLHYDRSISKTILTDVPIFFQYSCLSVSNSITSSNHISYLKIQGHSKSTKSSTRIFSVAHKIRCEPMEFVARLQSNLRGETSEVLVNWIFKYFVKSVILPHFNHTDTFLLILFFCNP